MFMCVCVSVRVCGGGVYVCVCVCVCVCVTVCVCVARTETKPCICQCGLPLRGEWEQVTLDDVNVLRGETVRVLALTVIRELLEGYVEYASSCCEILKNESFKTQLF